MKRLLILFLLVAPAAQAGGISHKITATAQASVDGSYSHAKRVGSTYSMSSSGVTASTMGHLDVPASANNALTGVAATHGTGSYTQTTAGAATTFSETFVQGDAMPSATSLTHGAVGSLPMLGDTITYTGGDNTGLAATITSVSGGTIGLTAGKSGTSVTGSITSALSIGD
jgi:hypothetical protein